MVQTNGANPAYYGTVLKSGSQGPDVALVQSWLTGITGTGCNQTGPGSVDGMFGAKTEASVMAFQASAGLTTDGKVGSMTWNALGQAYAAQYGPEEIYPGIAVRQGARGAVVKSMQKKLSDLSKLYTAIPGLSVDGAFGNGTADSLEIFQMLFHLQADEVMGKATFSTLQQVWQSVQNGSPQPVTAPYGGTALKVGSDGSAVRIAQSWLAAMGGGVPAPAVDGKFGANTRNSTLIFQSQQGLTADGVIGTSTWNTLREAFNSKL